MIFALKSDAKLAHASISNCRGDLEHTQLCAAKQLCRPCQTEIQNELVDRGAIKFPERCLQARAGDPKTLRELLDRQALFQMLQNMIVDPFHKFSLLAIQMPAPFKLMPTAGMGQIEQFQGFEDTVISAAVQRQLIQREEQRLTSKHILQYGTAVPWAWKRDLLTGPEKGQRGERRLFRFLDHHALKGNLRKAAAICSGVSGEEQRPAGTQTRSLTIWPVQSRSTAAAEDHI